MADDSRARAARVRAVVAVGRRLCDPRDDLGARARRALPALTGLTPQGVELGLTRHLETHITPEHLAELILRAPRAPRVQVVLSANVFVAALRAIALAVAASDDVVVRPSSREPIMAGLIAEGLAWGPAPITLTRARDLAMRAGDEVHLYGRRETIAAFAEQCPPGVTLRAHGPGCGVAVVESSDVDLRGAARELSWDVIAFDQRGCLSPRLAFVEGAPERAEQFAGELSRALAERAIEVPRGARSSDELAAYAWYRRAVQATGTLHDSESSTVGCDVEGRALLLPPTGRCVQVVGVRSAAHLLTLMGSLTRDLTCIGASGHGHLIDALHRAAPAARVALLGQMQRPPLDGPVDLRHAVDDPVDRAGVV